MSTLELPVRSDFQAYGFDVDLEGTPFRLDFQFNERLEKWIMGISDTVGNEIILGLILQVDRFLTKNIVREGEPPGQFLLIDETGQQRDPGRSDLGNDIKLLYIEAT